MNGIMGRLAVATCVLTAVWFGGCGKARVAPGPDVPMATVQEECKTFKVPQLRERATAYRDLIRKAQADVDEKDQQIATARNDFAPEHEIAKLQTERDRLEKMRMDLHERYQMYLPVLLHRGEKLDDFRIEEQQPEETPIPQDAPPPNPMVR